MSYRYEIGLSGSGGQGIITAAIVLAEAIGVYDGKFVAQTQSYGPEARGGSSRAEVIVSDEEIDSTLVLSVDTDKSQVYSLTLYGKRDKRKNILNPLNSSYVDMSVAFSYSEGREQGTNSLVTNQYITLTSSWQRYQPWRPKVLGFKRWNFTFASRLKAGAIFEPVKRGVIPINDRFFAGGAILF